MNLFDELVTEALKNQSNLASLRVVVEKELLHHDLLRILSQNNLLNQLTFIGGTCLRACYGGSRLSEDLDFTGGESFNRESLSTIGEVITTSLDKKYGLPVVVDSPTKDSTNVDTWKIKIQTRPKQKHLPAQRINIDICAVPSYDKRPMMLLNPYGVDMGTQGLIIQAQSREEIYTDKLLAFALRPNRLKYRDLWDIMWLNQQGIRPNFLLVTKKLNDRQVPTSYFFEQFKLRHELLLSDAKLVLEFKNELQRFLPGELFSDVMTQENLWEFVTYLLGDLFRQLSQEVVR